MHRGLPDRVIIGGLAAAGVVGLLTARSPVLATALVVAVVAALAVLAQPVQLLALLLLSNAVRWADLPFPLAGSVFYVQKALLFVLLIRLLLRHRGRWFGLAPLVVLTVGAVYTWVLSSPIIGLNISQTVQSWATLVLAWLAVSVTLSVGEWRRLLVAMAWVPATSVLAGVAFSAAGVIDGLTAPDSTGAERLSGATIPAYLAAVAACAVVASALLAMKKATWTTMVVVNLAIVMATAGRGAILFAIISLTPLVVALLLSTRLTGSARIFGLTGIAATVAVLSVVFVPVLLSRTETSDGLNSSGRTEAWAFFLDVASVNPVFGRGLGAGPLASAYAPRGVLPDTFVAQHSEYVRLILELGYVGLVLFVVAMLLTFRQVIVSAKRHSLGMFAAAVCLAFLVYSGTDNTLTDFQFGVPVGLLLGAIAVWRRAEKPQTWPPARGNTPVVPDERFAPSRRVSSSDRRDVDHA